MEQDTFRRVSRIIAKYLEIPVEDVGVDAHLLEDLEVDSLGSLELVLEIEEEFDVVVPEERVVAFTTVRSVCEGVDQMLLESRTAP